MTTKKIVLAAAVVVGTVLSVSSAALAQSAYTTGTVASSERAGYPAPAAPYGGGLYAYAPGYGSADVATPGYGPDGRTHLLRGRVER